MTCYCGAEDLPPDSNLQCKQCDHIFHPACLKDGKPSNLEGDVLYEFICVSCSPTGDEQVTRMKLQWSHVLQLTLYNLQLQGGGKCGYFQYKEHICNFVINNWKTFFPTKAIRKNWTGTVSGTLSTAKSLFQSGTNKLKEQGWWALQECRPPTRREMEENLAAKAKLMKKKRKNPNTDVIQPPLIMPNEFDNLGEFRERRISRRTKKAKHMEAEVKIEPEISISDDLGLDLLDDSMDPIYADVHLDEDLIDISPGSISPLSLDPPSPSLEGILSQMYGGSVDGDDVVEDAENLVEEKDDEIIPTPSEEYSDVADSKFDEHEVQEEQFRTVRISQYEERKLLQQLESYPKALAGNSQAKRLRRKLLLLKNKRELNLPIFNLDRFVTNRLWQAEGKTSCLEMESIRCTTIKDDCILDRFQIPTSNIQNTCQRSTRTTFMAKLAGCEESNWIISQFTNNKLPPFIWKDYKTKPLKLKLLEEIQQRHKKKETDWAPPESSPICYCYVQPQHIPAVNALCREFFWQGIEMSECLKYPDYSCIALYKKIVIGFAFVVPNVKYNEAYISFLFTHPEWRNAGIATFMLYHLIQMCRGKDITLHVSARNPAMLLYQKFGFKTEEFIMDFYDKYYPVDSKECKHALFIRRSW